MKKKVGAQPRRTIGQDELTMDCSWEPKDFGMYSSAKELRHSETMLLQKLYEFERAQILTILMLAMRSNRFAGYMLTVNRSMFLGTDGSVAWLYHCPIFFVASKLGVLHESYDRTPILYQMTTKYVDRITGQTFHCESEIPCHLNKPLMSKPKSTWTYYSVSHFRHQAYWNVHSKANAKLLV